MEGAAVTASPAHQLVDRTRNANLATSHTNLNALHLHDGAGTATQNAATDPIPLTTPMSTGTQTAGLNNATNSGLSGLVCNVHRTTGREPRPLVGASTTIVGDKLYVFGGRKLSRTKPQLTSDLFELDLVRRHWSKLETGGDVPPPRYFHSVCALGDTKLVCYGGMSPAVLPNGQPTIPDQPINPQDPQPEVVVMSDIHILDLSTNKWMRISTAEAPQGRYAHCASILPSSSLFTSPDAAKTALQHNSSSPSAPNSGQLGVTLDGTGGAEMIVVGGQDSANHYIEQISVFNLRSLRWTTTTMLGRSCGAYRSVTAPIDAAAVAQIGSANDKASEGEDAQDHDNTIPEGSAAMLIYSNYNFLDVKLELQIRLSDGSLVEKPMQEGLSPPGLRFPNGGVIDGHFVVSGTFLTTAKQEYALWALDLRNLTWSRIDAGGSTFTHGSWNRGVLWNRRSTFVVLGNRKRSLVEDYNHRRINFSNVCMVELEAFGLYDNPRRKMPNSSFESASSPRRQIISPSFDNAGGRQLTKAAEELGYMALSIPEMCDMEFIAMNGERVPANSRIVAKRWGPYFNVLMRESLAASDASADTATLRPGASGAPSRNSGVTITPSINTTYSTTSTLRAESGGPGSSTASASNDGASIATTAVSASAQDPSLPLGASTTQGSPRPRSLYLPHTSQTIRALLHFLYTSSLPSNASNLCTPQVLCSLLQLARPYSIDGLLEAVVERLHKVLDNRNTAAIFNAAAMAAGGGEGVRFFNPALATILGERVIPRGGLALAPIELPASPVVAAAMAAGRVGNLNALAGIGLTGDADPDAAAAALALSATSPLAGNHMDGIVGLVNGAAGSSRMPLRIDTRFEDSISAARRPSTSTERSIDSALTSDSEIDDETDGDRDTTSESASGHSSHHGLRRGSTTSASASSSGRPGSSGRAAGYGSTSAAAAAARRQNEAWAGGISAVVGLQKRGLRGLMEGRRIREAIRDGTQIGTPGTATATSAGGVNGDTGSAGASANRVGLGIAQP